jgi:hypothetical protein
MLTIWLLCGINLLLHQPGLSNVPKELYDRQRGARGTGDGCSPLRFLHLPDVVLQVSSNVRRVPDVQPDQVLTEGVRETPPT